MNHTRLKSIDILRAVTMLLMIFVNDLWSLSGIPAWLEHKPADADGMGLADVVFPAFLFIVGLSVPYAIKARLSKGESRFQVLRHIGERTLALLVMGVFMVNLEYIDQATLPVSKPIWQILMTLAFFLIWNLYQGRILHGISPVLMKATGWTILLLLAIIYRAPDQGEGTWMHFHWWGILGLIGWGYLFSAVIYLFMGNRPGWLFLILIFFYLLNINEFIIPFNVTLKLIVSASNYTLVMGGVLTTAILIQLKEKNKLNYLVPFLIGFAVLFILSGLWTRPEWGISKIRATPSWTAICSGITVFAFGVLYLLSDKLGIYRWSGLIKAAGTSTLTCYLLPYFIYALWTISGIRVPDLLNTGMIGLLKSLLFALMIIQLTGFMGKLGVRLKI